MAEDCILLSKLTRLDIDGRRIKTIAKATDVRLRSLGKKFHLAVTNARRETYPAFAARNRVV